MRNTTRLQSTCVTSQGSTRGQTVESNHIKLYNGTYFKLCTKPQGCKGYRNTHGSFRTSINHPIIASRTNQAYRRVSNLKSNFNNIVVEWFLIYQASQKLCRKGGFSIASLLSDLNITSISNKNFLYSNS